MQYINSNTLANTAISEFMEISKNLHMYESPVTGEYVDTLIYNSSWDWLMPVIEKIEELQDVNCLFCIQETTCQLSGDFPLFIQTRSKIGSVYLCVIEFIKWYNDQRK